MRPTGLPVAPGEQVLGLGVLEERVVRPVQAAGACPARSGAIQRGSLR